MPFTVAVRTLCEFAARRGDLDLRFTPAPSAQEGIAGHLWVTERRAEGYETEIALRGSFEGLEVRGRADGFDPALNRLEEIKTHRGDLARQPANHRALHWAQARCYGALLCEARGLAQLDIALVYFDIATQRETVLTETWEAPALREAFEALCRDFLAWAQQESAHRAARDAALQALAFPHPDFRTGQRELAEAVYRGAATGRCVLAQAPTGIGKTVGTLFPLLKAAPAQALDKVFYLTAKTTGRQLALDAAQALGAGRTLPLRVVELVAREKACEHPGSACHGESCPLARGFWDRLPAARSDALQSGLLDAPALREVARRHAVCPYYLSQELCRWTDVVVGDYNYWFDGSALLHALALEQGWRVAVLADEAHNLVERAREMYSAEIAQADLRALRRTVPQAVRGALDKVQRGWSALRKAREAAGDRLDGLPANFLQALRGACTAIEEHFAQAAPGASLDEGLQQAWFGMLGFLKLAETFGEHSVLEWREQPAARGGRPDAVLRIQNLVPASFLAPRFAATRTSTLFSATLSPPRYALDMLGLPQHTAWVDVASPFSAAQLQVRIVQRISTRWADRGRSVAPIAELIARQFEAAPGNYLAFFSSFDYLAQVADAFEAAHPQVPAWRQSRRMGEAERSAFLARFQPGGQGVGFAVLGGSFGEGVDLRGDRLVGAFVATLGLPQVNPRNEALKARLEQAFGRGWDYAYLVPGLQKVVQAAGRVIRTPEDRGVVWLIDDRFGRPAVRELLPAWWRIAPAGDAVAQA
ncbi:MULTISPECIES: ATP-dependent DNA helicase [Ramlibacter]|uniref:ATP-dependent DNA helicase n=1 Tax=Ramlibacter aquaticus TaxID=2780094 RepID=A0ABR9SEA2_9BURK|nr:MULTISPECIES: ATP-dependent DNA helicase [Ramlibacter]MBE7940372.1 ATP-dependent DNA helicase [Ramlibacter aquaticus]